MLHFWFCKYVDTLRAQAGWRYLLGHTNETLSGLMHDKLIYNELKTAVIIYKHFAL